MIPSRYLTAQAAAVTLALAITLCLAPSATDGKLRTYGNIPPGTHPSCDPKPKECTLIGRVTAFQARTGRLKAAYSVRRPGRVVAWGVALGTPGGHADFFDRTFGAGASARLVILRPHPRRKNMYRLKRQSDTVSFNRYFGAMPAVATRPRLAVEKGDVIGLSVPTWVPAFGLGRGTSYTWRGSRPKHKCSKLTGNAVHVGRSARYECSYRRAQILYWATVEQR